MIEETIEKIEARLQGSDSMPPEKRKELAELLAKLKSEVAGLSRTHAEQAESIAGFADVSTHEATREKKNPALLELSVNGLKSSVEEFEKSHPKLVEIVNSISNALSNLGI